MNGTEPGVVNVVDVQLFCQFNVSLALSWCDNPPCSVVVVMNPPIVAMPVCASCSGAACCWRQEAAKLYSVCFSVCSSEIFAPFFNAGAKIKSAPPAPYYFL